MSDKIEQKSFKLVTSPTEGTYFKGVRNVHKPFGYWQLRVFVPSSTHLIVTLKYVKDFLCQKQTSLSSPTIMRKFKLFANAMSSFPMKRKI